MCDWFVVLRFVRLKLDFSSEISWRGQDELFWPRHPGDDLCIHSPIISLHVGTYPCSALLALRRLPGKFPSALDCGAGVGRITQGLLLDRVTDAVDLLEPCGHLLQERCG